jgi:hypothetical protein
MATPSDERIVIETPTKKRWRLTSLGIIVTILAAGLVGSRTGNFTLILGLVGLVFFGPMTIASLVRALRNRPVLILDADGFTDYGSLISAGRVPWQEVSSIENRAFRRRVFVAIKVTDRAAFLARQSAWHRFLRKVNGPMAAGDILIPDSVLPMRPAELLSTMRRLQRAAQRSTPRSAPRGGTGRPV